LFVLGLVLQLAWSDSWLSLIFRKKAAVRIAANFTCAQQGPIGHPAIGAAWLKIRAVKQIAACE